MWKTCGNFAASGIVSGLRPILIVAGATMATAFSYEVQAWDLIKAKLAESIPAQDFENWVHRTSQERMEFGSLHVRVPDQVTKDFIQQEYAAQITTTIRELDLPVTTIVYVPIGLVHSPSPAHVE